LISSKAQAFSGRTTLLLLNGFIMPAAELQGNALAVGIF
jgi:hypothetical protein